MKWLNNYIQRKKALDLERKKESIISNTVQRIIEDYEPLEQVGIVNQIQLRLFDKTKEGRANHLKIAREYTEALKEINLKG